MAKYLFYQKATVKGKTVHGLVEVVNSKKKALKLINDYNKILTGNPNLKKVLNFTYPLREHLDNFKKWSNEKEYKKEVRNLEKYNGIENIENLVYSNKFYSVIKLNK